MPKGKSRKQSQPSGGSVSSNSAPGKKSTSSTDLKNQQKQSSVPAASPLSESPSLAAPNPGAAAASSNSEPPLPDAVVPQPSETPLPSVLPLVQRHSTMVPGRVLVSQYRYTG